MKFKINIFKKKAAWMLRESKFTFRNHTIITCPKLN